MNRDNPLRSRLDPHSCFCHAFLLTSLSLVAYPAWSVPIEIVSHSAIDLIAAKQQPDGLRGLEYSEAGNQESTVTPIATRTAEPTITTPDIQSSPLPHAASRHVAQTLNSQPSPLNPDSPIDLDPTLINSSPVLQRWLKQVPDVLADMKRDPSFRTRLRLGYTQFPSSNQAGGLSIGIEDVFIGQSGLTLSADYQTAFNGQRTAWGSDLRYYIRPLGRVVNVAPILGYRQLETTRYSTEGLHVGLRLLLVPSRKGAADLALTQSWVAPRSENEVGLTTLSFGYAVTHNLRLSTEIQKQNSRFRRDSRVGISLEWMF